MSFARLRPYIDRGKPGTLRYQGSQLLTVRLPLPVAIRRLALEVIRRHNSLEPELQETHRILLRWSEDLGDGLPNPEAQIRETHYDPLPPEIHEKVTLIVDGSPFASLMRKLYRTALTGRALADELGVSHTKLLSERRSALWYYRGRFEADRIHG